VEIVSAQLPADLPAIAQLFRAYAATLPVDFCTQGFDEEIAALPGQYAPPQGALLIAREANTALGCVAMRPLGVGVAEMKRLYVAPEGRGRGVGRALTRAIIDAARAAGHTELRLDTLAPMREAQALYRSLGFTEIAPYNDNPPDITTFMSLKL
jgi:ribosomal protein S18 acetylase RimI-like enzyme